MWWFRKKRSYRADTRRPPGEAALWQRFVGGGGVGSLLLAMLFFAGTFLLDSLPPDPLTYRVGQYVPDDLRARVALRQLSTERLRDAVVRAESTVPATFRLNRRLRDEIITTLGGLPDKVAASTQPAALDETTRKTLGLTSEADLHKWAQYAEGPKAAAYQASLKTLKAQLGEELFVRGEEAREQQMRLASEVKVAGESGTTLRRMGDLVPLNMPVRVRDVLERLSQPFDADIRGHIRNYLQLVFLTQMRPLYDQDVEASLKDKKAATDAIELTPPPEAYKSYTPGDVLVPGGSSRGDRPKGLSAADLELLQLEQEHYREAMVRADPLYPLKQFLGRAVTILLVVAIFCLYVLRYRPQLVQNHWRGMALTLFLLLMLGVNKVMFWAGWNENAAVGPLLMAAVVLAVAFDQRFSLVVGTILSLLLVLQLREGVGLFVVLLSGLTACMFQLREVRSRSKLIMVSLFSAVVVMAAVLAEGLYRDTPGPFLLSNGLWAGGASLLVGFLSQGTLPLVERIFRVATSITLMEWGDASQPLQRRLAMEAPGTYNHSLQLGAMCEAAAEAIGARGLLARVGAYYHDIGKLNKPAYFIENQAGYISKHQKLSPEMSLLIITSHVKDGLELAREYDLPAILHEFIATHHGTTLVQYFFQQAAEQRKADAERPPEEFEFRYPGPKPRSKEAAILMMADASESSIRTMADPTPGRIENQVHTMVMRRLMDGQLDDCELTLREVHQIEDSLVKSLSSIYHSRISYPTPAGQRPSAAEMYRKDSARPHEPANAKPAEEKNDPEEKTPNGSEA